MQEDAHATDASAVTALLHRLVSTWEKADAESYADCFTDDADYVTFTGTHLSGRRQIVDCHDALWQTFQKDTRLHQTIRSLRFVAEDVAVVVGRGAVLKVGRPTPKPRDWKVQTLVAARQSDGTWKFTAFQNTRHRRLFERIAARKDPRLTGGRADSERHGP